jgi:RNA polymerase sigma-70 factor (ECF subfamily)
VGWTRGGADRVPAGSFESWFERLVPFAYNVGYRFSAGNRAFAEDVAQEALTRAYAVWSRIEGHPNLEAWVTTAAFRVALEMARQQERARRPDPSAARGNVPGDDERVVEVDALGRAMRKLSARQQEVLVWRFWFDESVEGTAERLGLTASKVKDATHEATTKLRRVLPQSAEAAR